MIFFIATIFIFIAFPDQSRAVTFPITYSGVMHHEFTITSSNGTGTCQMEAKFEITLNADGTLTGQGDQVSIYGHSNDKPPWCEMSLTGKTTTVTGTHDINKGTFIIPMASPLEGTYDENLIKGSMTYGSFSMWCELPSAIHRIAIKPTPSFGFDFHKSILEGKGFTIEVFDPQGRDHLDWNSFQVFVNGNDTSALFWDKTSKGVVPMKDESVDSLTKVFRLIPDPQKLMAGSDIFAIPWNGNWLIELKICDKSGFCFQSKDNVYFGPFIAFSNAVDMRCYNSPDSIMQIFNFMAGNTGINSPKTGICLALLNTVDPYDFWTLNIYDGAWWQNQLWPLMMDIDFPSGLYLAPGTFPVPLYRTGTGTIGVPAGKYKLITGALDTDTGVWGMDWHDIEICDP
jgi:hypothetical protein